MICKERLVKINYELIEVGDVNKNIQWLTSERLT
jgi:hypothetical protein